MFRIEELYIENFRGVREARVQLHPQATVFFGPNAGGKSSLLDAVAIALGPIVERVPGAKSRRFASSGDIRTPWLDREDIDESAGVEAKGAWLTVRTVGGVEWDTAKFRSRQAREGSNPRRREALHRWLDPLLTAVQEARRKLSGPALPFVAAFGNERAGVEIPKRKRQFSDDTSRFKALDESLSATTRFKAVFEWFNVKEIEELREMRRRDDLGYRLPALEWVRRAVERSGLRCSNPRIENAPIRMMVDYRHEDDSIQTLDIRQLSDGYRTHFALIVDLARRMVQLNPCATLDDPERGTNSAGVVIIDEIDLHLDPVWQSRVVQGLVTAFPNVQFVLSTHSEQVIGSVRAEQVRRLRWHRGEIVVERVPFAQGATGERILVELMHAWERVPGPIKEKLERYLAQVQAGDGQAPDAVALRRELEAALPNDPMLGRADGLMKRQALWRRFPSLEQ